MQMIISTLLKDKTWFVGLILTLVSAFFFFWGQGFVTASNDAPMGIFFLNYFFVLLYFVVVLADGSLRRGRDGIAHVFVLLVLFLISAYALNRELTIFERAVGWWAFLLIACCVNYLLIPFFSLLANWAQHVVAAVAGLSLMVFLYLMLYLLPLYWIGALATPFLGISLHTFVPMLFFIYTIVFIRRAGAQNRRLFISFWSTVLLVVVGVVIFISRWFFVTLEMNIAYNKAAHSKTQDLPAWVYTAQRISPGIITEKILKTKLVYSVQDGEWNLFSMPGRNFGEQKKHDPLVVLGALFSGAPQLGEDERVKVLESVYDSRHQAQERFWKGDDLYTEKVITSIELWPNQHLSYTEKQIVVTNKNIYKTWGGQQEAIYTFHLPEGGVVSSLSLWINGKEEKGLLTSRSKADSAYRTIVGHESRDPSVVHWQEGNTVSVRVFPVVAGESRQFKIGITAPLEKAANMLGYSSVYFDGPSTDDASEQVSIHSDVLLQDLNMPYFLLPGAGGKESNSQSIHYEGKYRADWGFRFRDGGSGREVFTFGGKQYALTPYYKERETVDNQQVYLDINRSWSRDEYKKVIQAVAKQKTYVYSPSAGVVAVTGANADSLFDELSQLSFSLFPLQVIKDPARSLLISRSGPASPSLRELDSSSNFARELSGYLAGGVKIRLFNLGPDLSPYLKSLKEFKVFCWEQGSVEELKSLLEKKQFVRAADQQDQVVIEQAGIVISRQDKTRGGDMKGDGAGVKAGSADLKTSAGDAKAVSSDAKADEVGVKAEEVDVKAPDHLLRLFAYNHILAQMGTGLAAGKEDAAGVDTGGEENALVREAQQAHIVTPVSSLVVLEKQADYDRFNIKDSKDGLANAALHGKGAVPEPAEWALIAMVVAVLVVVKFKYYRAW